MTTCPMKLSQALLLAGACLLLLAQSAVSGPSAAPCTRRECGQSTCGFVCGGTIGCGSGLGGLAPQGACPDTHFFKVRGG
jgi:hypothetical protein